MQLSLATGLVQGGERGHCKGSRERPVSRDYAQVEQRGQAPLVLHSPEPGEREGRASGVWAGGGRGARGVLALQGAHADVLGGECSPPPEKQGSSASKHHSWPEDSLGQPQASQPGA